MSKIITPTKRVAFSCLLRGFLWWRGLILGISALAVGTNAPATSVVPPDFLELVNQADYIVRVVVKSVASEWRTSPGQRHIFTRVELEVKEVIAGTPPQPLVLEMLGGKMGDEELVVEGVPRFKVGDEDILFVHGNGQQFCPLVAIMHGRYPIMRDSDSGRRYIARSNGVPLFDEKEVSLPMSRKVPAAQAARTGLQSLSPADFVKRIQAMRHDRVQN